MNKKSYLVTVGYLIELTDEEKNEIGEKLMSVIPDEITININKQLKWESTSTICLDPKTMNCGRCQKCNSWVTDREKPNHIEQLNNGAVVDGQLLCDECLPEDDRWSF